MLRHSHLNIFDGFDHQHKWDTHEAARMPAEATDMSAEAARMPAEAMDMPAEAPSMPGASAEGTALPLRPSTTSG